MIRRAMIFTIGGGVAALLALILVTHHLSRPKIDGRLEGDPLERLVIAPLDEAVTLAFLPGPDARVLLIAASGPEGLAAVDLEVFAGRAFDDTVDAFLTLGHAGLTHAAEKGERFRVEYADLGLPFVAAYPHIAAGTNFVAHAEEVGREEGPFLFPKLAEPTAWNADVPDRARLDYEVEICAVTLTPHSAKAPAQLGYTLCNDFTDRWTLVREIDLGAPMGQTGFADAKGGVGMLTVGPLLVVPREPAGFHEPLVLELWVNGALRQHAVGGLMEWPPEEVLTRAFGACDVDYTTVNGAVDLTDCETIPARTLVLTGTPAGVMFHPVTIWSKRAYLVPGDEVVAAATHLGVLRNTVR